jgi:chromosome segregation ATPase
MSQDHPVTRNEFNAAIRHLENLLQQQTEILQALAVNQAENKARDEKIAAHAEAIKEIRAEQKAHSDKLSWYAGALAALGLVWPFISKKLGLT